ncbi:forkhead box protein A2-B-like [Selaginella moellendorffii]|uniref:CLAVATA3/endosperm surrounding region 12 n=1 Tax=Selaginella moellendorffii TaxID=88036 RepID=C0STP0_SELML|nr:forkhead box protein A2-B-like [Selaginella moellendorffii]BAH56543.1 CLAVATA3/endosperm surrounding region 12 [Selaginella moellendorffii]|eukprot:XP_024531981.1 forkhead box protein A2-B-like [Selaginella moellendorffii]
MTGFFICFIRWCMAMAVVFALAADLCELKASARKTMHDRHHQHHHSSTETTTLHVPASSSSSFSRSQHQHHHHHHRHHQQSPRMDQQDKLGTSDDSRVFGYAAHSPPSQGTLLSDPLPSPRAPPFYPGSSTSDASFYTSEHLVPSGPDPLHN